MPVGTTVLFTIAADDDKAGLITLTAGTIFFTLALPAAPGVATRLPLGSGRVTTFEITFAGVTLATRGTLDGTMVIVADFPGILDEEGGISSWAIPTAVLPSLRAAPDVTPTAVTFTEDALGVQLLALANTRPKGLGTAAETAAPTGTFAPVIAIPAPAALPSRRSDDCCDTVACCMGELEAESSDVAGIRSTLPRASVHFTNVDEMTPFELTAAGTFGSTDLDATLRGGEAAPATMHGDGICTTALTLGLLALHFAAGGFEISISTGSAGQGSVSATALPAAGSVFDSLAKLQGCSVAVADDTMGTLSDVLEVSECCRDVGSSGKGSLQSPMLIEESFSGLSATKLSLLDPEADSTAFLSGPALVLCMPPLDALMSFPAVDESSDLVAEAGNQRSTTVSAPSVCSPV